MAKDSIKIHPCDICSKTFLSAFKLKTHLFQHKAVPARFKCPVCLKEYFRKDEYTRHVLRHNNNQKIHFCDHCGRGFVDKRNLINHLTVHDDLHVPKKRYHCVVCDISYCEDRILKYHIRKYHMNLKEKTPTYTEKSQNESWIEPTMVDKSCVQITKVANNKLSIQSCNIKAEKTAHSEKTLTSTKKRKKTHSTYLSSVFAKNSQLYSKAICDYCKKEMLKKSLHNHIRERHLKVRRFHCFVCMRSFNRNYHLSEHNCGKVRRSKNNENVIKKKILK